MPLTDVSGDLRFLLLLEDTLDSGLHFLDFFVAVLLSNLDHFHEVIRFEDCSMRLNLDHISVYEFFVWKHFLCDYIAHVDDTVLFWVGVVVEEDVLGSVVSLVHQKQFCGLSLTVIVVPGFVVVLHCHNAEFLECLKRLLINLDWFLQQVAVFELLLIFQDVLKLVKVMGFSLERALEDLGVLHVRGVPELDSLLHRVSHS